MSIPWQIWIDTGGTFTDGVGVDPDGALHRAKVLSNSALRGSVRRCLDQNTLSIHASWAVCDDLVTGATFRILGGSGPDRRVRGFDHVGRSLLLDGPLPVTVTAGDTFEVRSPEPAPLLAARLLTRTPAGAALPAIAMRLATTRATNALLERRGAPTALFITEGFGDLLRIGNQQRPDLFRLDVRRPAPLPEAVVEVPERIGADGAVVRPLEMERVLEEARRLLSEGVRTAAVALMHAYVNPDHEERLTARLLEMGFEHVAGSARLAPLIKILPRAETAVADAYLGPVIAPYLRAIEAGLAGGPLHVLTSAGGLVPGRACAARDTLLSGPAGGVAGAAGAGRAAGFDHVIGFDMGGTSTDVARYDGDYEYQFEHEVGGVHLVAPALAIETVAAGGGSICHVEGGCLRVGPRSASADPGPACYGAGGPLTLTDVNLLMGRVDPERFEIPLAPARAAEALDALCLEVTAAGGAGLAPEDALDGLLDIANERMADAIAAVSLRRGYDPASYALVAFGGAGGQHACAVADRLGMDTVLMPPDASLLSAVGLGHAVVERFAHRQVLERLDTIEPELPSLLDALAARARDEVAAEGVDRDAIEIRRRIARIRLEGQETPVEIEVGAVDRLREEFAVRYESIYGHRPSGKAIEVESLRVVASARAATEKGSGVFSAATAAAGGPAAEETPDPFSVAAQSNHTTRVRFAGAWRTASLHRRGDLEPGAWVDGPALVFDHGTSWVIEPGWRAEAHPAGGLIARRSATTAPASGVPERHRPEVVRQELFTNRFASIADEMGQMLQRTSISTNVKERLDFSCALLDPDGALVVNAPHIPVHLGALGLCVRALLARIEMGPGDVVVTNHPGCGGSHLPDVTVVAAVHDSEGRRLGFAANRAHHAEIGGIRPGSMPPEATVLGEEGVVIEPMHLLRGGEARFDDLRRILEGGPHPSRTPDDNIADLRGQVAAVLRGGSALADLAARHGTDEVTARMGKLTDRAERATRAALAALPDGAYEARERLDDGSPLQVRITVLGDRAVVDFRGSAPLHPGNLNATPAIVHSAVIYVLRLLVGERLPLNEGIMRAVDVRIDPGILDPVFTADPWTSPAVVGGNVETSQRFVDTLLKALGLCACSQGTMNNVLFGTDHFAYYETVCGGAGAGPGFAGASAVHTHMTNTRITDPELLEIRYPVPLERFAVRPASGGAGAHRGGDGVVREYRFGAPMSVSLLSQHRAEGPYGLAGGAPGRPGTQRVIRAGGAVESLGGAGGCEVAPGDRLVLETPGGGGWGASPGDGLRRR